MEPWWVCLPVVADWHQFDEDHDPHPTSEVQSRNRIHIKVKSRIWIGMVVKKRIRIWIRIKVITYGSAKMLDTYRNQSVVPYIL
jgi:hypothetical protein